MKNIMDKIAKVKINPRYDISVADTMKILEGNNGDMVGTCFDGFRIGYLQGCKAAKAETRGYKKAIIEMLTAINKEQAIQRIYNLVQYFYEKDEK